MRTFKTSEDIRKYLEENKIKCTEKDFDACKKACAGPLKSDPYFAILAAHKQGLNIEEIITNSSNIKQVVSSCGLFVLGQISHTKVPDIYCTNHFHSAPKLNLLKRLGMQLANGKQIKFPETAFELYSKVFTQEGLENFLQFQAKKEDFLESIDLDGKLIDHIEKEHLPKDGKMFNLIWLIQDGATKEKASTFEEGTDFKDIAKKIFVENIPEIARWMRTTACANELQYGKKWDYERNNRHSFELDLPEEVGYLVSKNFVVSKTSSVRLVLKESTNSFFMKNFFEKTQEEKDNFYQRVASRFGLVGITLYPVESKQKQDLFRISYEELVNRHASYPDNFKYMTTPLYRAYAIFADKFNAKPVKDGEPEFYFNINKSKKYDCPEACRVSVIIKAIDQNGQEAKYGYDVLSTGQKFFKKLATSKSENSVQLDLNLLEYTDPKIYKVLSQFDDCLQKQEELGIIEWTSKLDERQTSYDFDGDER